MQIISDTEHIDNEHVEDVVFDHVQHSHHHQMKAWVHTNQHHQCSRGCDKATAYTSKNRLLRSHYDAFHTSTDFAIDIGSSALNDEEDEDDDDEEDGNEVDDHLHDLAATNSNSTLSALPSIPPISASLSFSPSMLQRRAPRLSQSQSTMIHVHDIHDCLDDDDDDDFDSETSPEPSAPPLQENEDKLHFFIEAFCPRKLKPVSLDILHLVAEFVQNVDSELMQDWFTWRLGLLDWRAHSSATKRVIRQMFGKLRCQKLIESIEYSITLCIFKYKLDWEGIMDDLHQSSGASHLVQYITRAVYPGEKGKKYEQLRNEIHDKLLHDVFHELPNFPPPMLSLESTQSTHRDLRVVALQTMSSLSPLAGSTLQRSIDRAVSPQDRKSVV